MTIEKILPRLTHWHSFVKSSHNKISISNAASHLYLSLCGPSKIFEILAENFFFLDEHTSIAPCFAADWRTVVRLCAKRSSRTLILKKVFYMNRKLHAKTIIWRLKSIKVAKDFKLNFKSSIFNIYKIPQHTLLTMIIATLDIFMDFWRVQAI